MKKIFATDYDGTLFQNENVTKKDLEAIKKFRSEGGVFGIATGRMISSIRIEIEKYDIPVDFVIGINGGVIVDNNFEEIHSLDIDNTVGMEVLDYLKESGAIHYSVSDGYDVSSFGEENEFLQRFAIPLEEILDNNIKGLYSSMPSIAAARGTCDEINSKYGQHVKALPNYNHIDIASSKTDKSIALSKYIQSYENPFVGTAGDAHNDLQMLKNFEGYAMHHGDQDVVSQISQKAGSISEAIKHFMSL